MLRGRRCVFHIGLPKTGSSSIQAFLRGHTEELLDHGIRFPIPETGHVERDEGRIPHFDLLQHFYKLARPDAPRRIDYEKVIDLGRRDPAGSTLLLTHEVQSLHGHNARAELFAGLRQTHDVAFMCYLRNPSSWLASYYEQAISQPNPLCGDPARHFAARSYLKKGFRGLIAPFRDLGRVELYDYDALRIGGQLVPEFLRRVGANALLADAEAASRVNSHAYSPEQIMIMRHLKLQGTDAGMFLRVRRLFDEFNRISSRQRSPIVLFPADLREGIEQQWEQDRQAFDAEITLSGNSPQLPDDPYRNDPEVLEAMMDFATTVEDGEAAAFMQQAVAVFDREAA